jgi:hypothetical protein
MPFFRAHAHIDTKRREPYLFDEPIRGYLRDAVRLRYQMLPVWYNAFYDASVGGYPIMRYVPTKETEREVLIVDLNMLSSLEMRVGILWMISITLVILDYSSSQSWRKVLPPLKSTSQMIR